MRMHSLAVLGTLGARGLQEAGAKTPTLKDGRKSLRCTIGRAKDAGACTSRSPTDSGYASLTCSWFYTKLDYTLCLHHV